MDDKPQEQQAIHLFELVIDNNRLAHGHNLRIMDEKCDDF